AAAVSGRCLLQLGETHQAERAFLFVLAQQPTNPDAHRGLAAVYFDQGALKRAAKHCEEWANLAPGDGRPCRFLALILKDLDHKSEAVAAYREALRRDLSDNVTQEVRVELAEMLTKTGAYAEALATLDRCDALAAQNPKVMTLRAEC